SLHPRTDLLKSVVYAMSPRAITDAWVHGRRVVDGGRLTTVDMSELLARVRDLTAGRRLSSRWKPPAAPADVGRRAGARAFGRAHPRRLERAGQARGQLAGVPLVIGDRGYPDLSPAERRVLARRNTWPGRAIRDRDHRHSRVVFLHARARA